MGSVADSSIAKVQSYFSIEQVYDRIFSHKYLQPIYFKHAHISQLPDFIAIQQFHSSRTFVEVVAKEGEDFLICNFINIKV